jgi:hypothetical protein
MIALTAVAAVAAVAAWQYATIRVLMSYLLFLEPAVQAVPMGILRQKMVWMVLQSDVNG